MTLVAFQAEICFSIPGYIPINNVYHAYCGFPYVLIDRGGQVQGRLNRNSTYIMRMVLMHDVQKRGPLTSKASTKLPFADGLSKKERGAEYPVYYTNREMLRAKRPQRRLGRQRRRRATIAMPAAKQFFGLL